MITIPFDLIDNPQEYADHYNADFNEPVISALREKAAFSRHVLQQAWEGSAQEALPLNAQPTARSFRVVGNKEGGYRLRFVTNIREQMKLIIEAVGNGTDTLPLFSCDFNTFVLSSVFGGDLKAEAGVLESFSSPQVNFVFDSREKLERLKPPTLTDGLIPKALKETRKLREVLPDWCDVGVRINTGPLSMACDLRGSDIFVDMFEAPDLYFHFMSILTELYIVTRRAIQEAAAYHYAPDEMHSDVPVHIPVKGILLCDDSMVLMSPATYEKYLLPFHRRIFDAFGGGVLHSCGDSTHLWPILSRIENLRGFEFGQPQLINHLEARKIFGEGFLIAAEDGIFSYGAASLPEAIDNTLSFLKAGISMINNPDGAGEGVLKELRKREKIKASC